MTPPYHGGKDPWLGYSTPQTPTSPPQILELLAPDGTVTARVTVPTYERDWYEIAARVYPTVNGALQMPAANISYNESVPPFNACTYTATEDYLAARFGRKLHSSDRDWLAWHPYAKDSGVPEAYTPTAIHQLVEPYGLGVARIRVRAGKLILGDELQMWALALGVNPFGLVDRTTNNTVAAERLNLSPADAEQWFRFEYHEDPLPCSIIGERGWSNGQGVQVGAMGGHARYLAPRATPNDWTLSLQLAPLEQLTYQMPLQLPAYKPRAGTRTLLLSTAKRPDGRPLVNRVGARYVDAEAPVATTVVTQADGSTKTTFKPTPTGWGNDPYGDTASKASKASPITPEAVQQQLLGQQRPKRVQRKCVECETWKSETLFLSGQICAACWDDAWEPFQCAYCKTPFKIGPDIQVVSTVVAADVDDWDAAFAEVTLTCPSCRQDWVMGLTPSLWHEHPELAAAIEATDEWVSWAYTEQESGERILDDLRLVPDTAADDTEAEFTAEQAAWANECGGFE